MDILGRRLLEKDGSVWTRISEKIETLPDNNLKKFLMQLFEEMKLLDCFEPAIGPGKRTKSDLFYVEWAEHGLVFTVSCSEDNKVTLEMLQCFYGIKSLKINLTFDANKTEKFPFNLLPRDGDEVRFFKIVKASENVVWKIVSFRACFYYDVSDFSNCSEEFQQDSSEIDLGCFIYQIEPAWVVFALPKTFINEYQSFQKWHKKLLMQKMIKLKHNESETELTFVRFSQRLDLLQSYCSL